MIIGALGILISVAVLAIAFPDAARRRIDVFAVVLIMHLAATAAYWLLAADAGYDAMFYYSDPLDWASRPFETGSVAVIHFVQALKSVFGGSFFAYFVFFQAFGMMGCAFILRSVDEIAASLDLPVPTYIFALLLFPGLHLWTVAIGKDAPLFMAVSMSVWASLRLANRFLWMALAVLIIGLVRPPVAVLMVCGLAATLMFDQRLTLGVKMLMGFVSALGLVAVVSATQGQLEITSLDTQGVVDFVERNQTLGQMVGGGAEIVNLPYPLKLLSLLFRPFFFDADGVLGLIASIENAVLLGLFMYLAINARTVIRLMRSVFCLSYCILFSTTLFAMLALLNYNVGLGLRQKMMGMPAVLVIVASVALYRRYCAVAAVNSQVGVAMPRMT